LYSNFHSKAHFFILNINSPLVLKYLFTLISPAPLVVGESPIWTGLKSGREFRGTVETPS